MKEIIQIISAVVGVLGFAVVFNVQKDKLGWIALGGLLSWSVYLGMEAIGAGDYLAVFTAAAATTAYAEKMARVCKTPAIIFVLTCTVPLIPGYALYQTMNCIVNGYSEKGFEMGLYTVAYASALSGGILISTVLFSKIFRLRGRARRNKR